MNESMSKAMIFDLVYVYYYNFSATEMRAMPETI